MNASYNQKRDAADQDDIEWTKKELVRINRCYEIALDEIQRQSLEIMRLENELKKFGPYIT